jgi:hypothetical protein
MLGGGSGVKGRCVGEGMVMGGGGANASEECSDLGGGVQETAENSESQDARTVAPALSVPLLLSQGQHKKLKQRKAKEKKEIARRAAGGILDEILGDTVYIGEIRVIENLINAVQKRLRRDVATAVQRLDHTTAYLEGAIALETAAILYHLYDSDECAHIAGEVVDIVFDDLVDAIVDPLFEVLLTTVANERSLLQEALAGKNQGFARELFVAAFPDVDPHSHDCSICAENVSILDVRVSTILCCDGRGLLCGHCRPGLVWAHENKVIRHDFSESFTYHINKWVGRMRLAFHG